MFRAWRCTTEELKMTFPSKNFQRKTVLAAERQTNTVLVNIVVCELNFCQFWLAELGLKAGRAALPARAGEQRQGRAAESLQELESNRRFSYAVK